MACSPPWTKTTITLKTENEEDDMENMDPDEIAEILHHLMDRVEQLEDENDRLREAPGPSGTMTMVRTIKMRLRMPR